jgi:hypothetical protein
LTAVLSLPAGQGREDLAPDLRMLPGGNLQVGVPGELLPYPIGVATAPGIEVTFSSPDLGLIEESGAATATVVADQQGLARVHVRLGKNLGRYTVIAGLAQGDGPALPFTFRAIRPESMAVRSERLGLARETSVKGGAR